MKGHGLYMNKTSINQSLSKLQSLENKVFEFEFALSQSLHPPLCLSPTLPPPHPCLLFSFTPHSISPSLCLCLSLCLSLPLSHCLSLSPLPYPPPVLPPSLSILYLPLPRSSTQEPVSFLVFKTLFSLDPILISIAHSPNR